MGLYFFFFQAEDGIRDKLVTGVQTCALPISKCRSARVAKNSGNLIGIPPALSQMLLRLIYGYGYRALAIRHTDAGACQRVRSGAHRATARVAGAAPQGGVGVSRAAVFFCDARHQDPL